METTDSPFILLTNKQEMSRRWAQLEEGAELWVGRRFWWLVWCPPPSHPPGRGRLTWCAQQGGKQNSTPLHQCLLSLSTGGNCSNPRKSESTEMNFKS